MRTKTLLLSALLGALGSVSVHAQNVYSLNAVGYINITALPGYNMISCPLIASPDNTIATLLNNASQQYTGDAVYFYNPATGGLEIDQATTIGTRPPATTNADGWLFAGTNSLSPGAACWFYNTQPTNVTLTFVGTVPSGALTNTLVTGFNMVSSILPTSGDLCTNSLTTLTNYNLGDAVYVFSGGTAGSFTIFQSSSISRQAGYGYSEAPGGKGDWNDIGDPTVPNVGQGFWYDNSGAAVNWVENYSVSQ
jgi:hypothetical protein